MEKSLPIESDREESAQEQAGLDSRRGCTRSFQNKI